VTEKRVMLRVHVACHTPPPLAPGKDRADHRENDKLGSSCMAEDLVWGPLKVGDWATWFSGIATFLAVCAALRIASWQAKRDRDNATRRERRRAQILAIDLAGVLLSLRLDMIKRRPILATADRGQFDGSPSSFVQQMTLYVGEGLPSGADLDGLPYALALAITSLKTMISMYNGTVDGVVGLSASFTVADCVAKVRVSKVLDDTQSALARAAKYLALFDSAYLLADFHERGDGTKIEPMPDLVELDGS